MAGADHGHHEHVVGDHVDHPVVAHPDPPQVLGSGELGGPFGARLDAQPSVADWVARDGRLAAGERWVLDGNYAGTLAARLQRADTVVFLDLPPLLCAWQVLRRWALGGLRPAPDLPAGLRPKLDPGFLAYVLGFRRRRRPALLAELARRPQGQTVVILRSRRDVRRFLTQLPRLDPARRRARDSFGGHDHRAGRDDRGG